jgi:hypothetical protein
MLQFDANSDLFATLLRRAWLIERFAISLNDPSIREQAAPIWKLLETTFGKRLEQYATVGIVQRRAVQIASRSNKGYDHLTWYKKTHLQRTRGDKFYKATHNADQIDPMAIHAAIGASGSLYLMFNSYAVDNKGCPISSICNSDITNYRVFLWFVTRAAIDYNEDIRRIHQQYMVAQKQAKKIKKKHHMPTDEISIAKEIKKQYKAIVNEILQSCDEKQIAAWCARINNAKRGKVAASKTKAALGLDKRSGWWTTLGLSQSTASDRSNIVRNKIDIKFKHCDRVDILSEVKVELANSFGI